MPGVKRGFESRRSRSAKGCKSALSRLYISPLGALDGALETILEVSAHAVNIRSLGWTAACENGFVEADLWANPQPLLWTYARPTRTVSRNPDIGRCDGE